MKLYYLQCKQFQFVDNKLIGEVTVLKQFFFRALSKYFSGKGGSAHLRKICPYAYVSIAGQLRAFCASLKISLDDYVTV